MPQNGYSYTQNKRSSTDKIPLIMLFVFLACIIILDQVMKLGLNWVDYTIIGIVFFSAFIGYVKGLIGAVFSLVGYAAAIVCAVLFSEPVALMIMKNTNIGKSVAESLEGLYSGISIPAFSQSLDLSSIQNNHQMLEQYPELKQFLQDNSMMGQLFDNVNPFSSGSQAISNAVTSITDVLVFSILKVIAIIVVFFIVKIIVMIIGRLINSLISQSNFLNTTNKTIGLVLGAIVGCVVVFIVITYVVPLIGSMNIVALPVEYNQSRVLGWLFSSNPSLS